MEGMDQLRDVWLLLAWDVYVLGVIGSFFFYSKIDLLILFGYAMQQLLPLFSHAYPDVSKVSADHSLEVTCKVYALLV